MVSDGGVPPGLSQPGPVTELLCTSSKGPPPLFPCPRGANCRRPLKKKIPLGVPTATSSEGRKRGAGRKKGRCGRLLRTRHGRATSSDPVQSLVALKTAGLPTRPPALSQTFPPKTHTGGLQRQLFVPGNHRMEIFFFQTSSHQLLRASERTFVTMHSLCGLRLINRNLPF